MGIEEHYEQLKSKLENKLGKMPDRKESEWWYGPDGKEKSSGKFKPKDNLNPYQGFVYLFGDALNAFSCFVKGCIDINSRHSNYHTIKPGEALVDENMGCWKGTIEEFLESAKILEHALGHVAWGQKDKIGFPNGEIKLVHPELGAISMKSFGESYKIVNHMEKYQISVQVPATLVMSKPAVDLLEKEDLSDHHMTCLNLRTAEDFC